LGVEAAELRTSAGPSLVEIARYSGFSRSPAAVLSSTAASTRFIRRLPAPKLRGFDSFQSLLNERTNAARA
jgi:hypothetical protein